MSRYPIEVRDQYGRPIPGATVYVFKWDADAEVAGDLETLTDDLSAPLANPLTADADGLAYFNSVDGQKLLEYHYGGKVQLREVILVGALPVPRSIYGGLFSHFSALEVPTGMDMVGTDGRSALDNGGANYVAGVAPTARSGATSANGRNFVLSKEQVIVPQQFYDATDPDFQNAMEGARDYLKTFALGTGGSGFYKGSPKLVVPAGLYDLHAAFDVNHTVVIEGEGAGTVGPQAFGCTRFRWPAGTSGFRIQHPTTEGDTALSGADHDGSGGAVLRDLMLEGGFAGAEGDFHGLVCRNAPKVERLYIKNWQGEGVKAWAGNVSGFGNVGGNNSTAMFDGVKVEDCRGAFDKRGSDSNLITQINCEAYACRQFGDLDDNGAGGSSTTGFHAASNGLVTGAWAQTQCSSGGNRYALKWGGDPTIAPSGTTADTANWRYVEAGGAIANTIPAWTATPNTFRAGGDYLTLNSAGVLHNNPYSEGGGFSQFNFNTFVVHGAIGKQYYRGGWRLFPSGTGMIFKTSDIGGNWTLEADNEVGVWAQTPDGTPFAYVDFTRAGSSKYLAATAHDFKIGTYASNTTAGTIDATGLVLPAGKVVTINSQQVVGARGAAVADAAALTSVDATNAAAAPTQAEFNAFVAEFNKLRTDLGATRTTLNTLLARTRASTGHGLIA
jgi:hypothetical protein